MFNTPASPLDSLGQTFIQFTPEWLKEFAIQTFGENDKTALTAGMGITLFVVAVVIGIVGRRAPARRRDHGRADRGDRRRRSSAAPGAVGASTWSRCWSAAPSASIFLVTVFRRQVVPDVSPAGSHGTTERRSRGRLHRQQRRGPVPAAVQSKATGIQTTRSRATSGAAHPMCAAGPSAGPRTAEDRRQFFRIAGIGAAGCGRRRRAGPVDPQHRRRRRQPQRGVPADADRRAAGRSSVALHVPGITPFVTDNADFYRVDTAFCRPESPPTIWQLRIHGVVDKRDHAHLRRPARDAVGRADDHADLRVQRGRRRPGRQRPLAGRPDRRRARDGRPAGRRRLRAVHQRRRLHRTTPLDGAHRRPRRVAGLRDERRAAAGGARLPGPDGRARPVRLRLRHQVGRRPQGHHVRRRDRLLDAARLGAAGTDQDGVPDRRARRASRRCRRATVAVAGVAWAQHRGISGVQVQIDDGDWQDATLSGEVSADTWRQWVYQWDATEPGSTPSGAARSTATGDGADRPGPGGDAGRIRPGWIRRAGHRDRLSHRRTHRQHRRPVHRGISATACHGELRSPDPGRPGDTGSSKEHEMLIKRALTLVAGPPWPSPWPPVVQHHPATSSAPTSPRRPPRRHALPMPSSPMRPSRPRMQSSMASDAMSGSDAMAPAALVGPGCADYAAAGARPAPARSTAWPRTRSPPPRPTTRC